jgi:RNA polymerase sigma-70 factor (ECF subfamily)
MATEDSFVEVIGRLQAGDKVAAEAVFNRFASQLVVLARKRLNTRLRQKVDEEDVVQSVFKSFFVRHADGQFTLENWNSLWGLLIRITLRKCNRWSERFQAGGGRDLGKEVSPAPATDSVAAWEAVARDPSPSEAAVLAETIEKLLEGFSDKEREIVTLRLAGYTVPEISREVKSAQRTVERRLGHALTIIRERHERMQESGEEF